MWWKVDFIWQMANTSWVAGPRRIFKALPKVKRAPKKGHGHCLVVCCPSDPLQLSESQWNHYICKVCSTDQWDAPTTAVPTAGVGQKKGPSSPPWQCLTAHCTTNTSEVEQVGLGSFASSTMFTWPLDNRLLLLQASQQLFCRKCFHNQQEAENAFREFVELGGMDFYITGINKHFSLAKMCCL